MSASKTKRNLQWVALAVATFAVAGQASADDAQVVEEPTSSTPSSWELSPGAHVEVESGAMVDQLAPIVLPRSKLELSPHGKM